METKRANMILKNIFISLICLSFLISPYSEAGIVSKAVKGATHLAKKQAVKNLTKKQAD